jgi:hypothetical protein
VGSLSKNIKGFILGSVPSAIANYITFNNIELFNVFLSGLIGIVIYRFIHWKD